MLIIFALSSYLKQESQNLIFPTDYLVSLKLSIKIFESLCLLIEHKLVVLLRISLSKQLILILLLTLRANFLENELPYMILLSL